MKHQPLKNRWIVGSLLSISLLFAQPAKAQIAEADTGEFRRIEQPLSLKLGVAAAGAGLIGIELWWFLFGKRKIPDTRTHKDIQPED